MDAKPSRATLLIVDDDAGNLEALGGVLEPQYNVLAAPSGERALRLASGGPPPDLILLDVQMPGIDGYEVLARLREDPVTHDIPVIFVTGMDSVSDEEKGLELGAVDYVTKPYRPSIILARVRTHLELKYARDRLAGQNAWLESEVARRTAENRLILESAAEGIFGVDACGAINFVNPAALAMLGYQHNELIGQSAYGLFHSGRSEDCPCRPDDSPVYAASAACVASHGREDVVWRKDGSALTVELSAVPMQSEGNHVGAVVTFTDIGERKEMERARSRYQSQLEDQVRQRTQDLSQRTDQLEAVNHDLEAFAYSVSHDLRAPLRAIDGFAAILRADYAKQLDEEGLRLLGIVSDGAKTMGQLIDDILAFSRASRLDVQLTELDMNRMVDEIWRKISEQTPGRKVEFRRENLPDGYGDPRAIGQAWKNLLANAYKFSACREHAIIEVTATTIGDTAYQYSVKDNGIGFDSQYSHKLFGLFQRLHGMDEFEGTGVGLAIVKRFIEKHGGEVSASGRPNGGATFSFTLPFSEFKKKSFEGATYTVV